MNAFEQLHPALQHHVVNSMGWQSLRPLQEESIIAILEGTHALILAPTAGGKTEAAVLPLLSRMLREEWTGLSVIYLCPIKALLNNLHDRLDGYCDLVGRRCAVWHGDIGETERNHIRRNPPDLLLTTPESLEAMLISRRTEHRSFFENLRAVVVDEIHAFAGDDRGQHLLAVLERMRRCAVGSIQRIGLSATVGNPEHMLEWLAGHASGRRRVVCPASPATVETEVVVDFVGSLENAAIVISRLHHGEKRLVFCDSRSRVEKLASLLRQAEVETHVSHSSLSAEERRRSEQAFAEGSNCVIVATSALELGLDVGNLDRVIQIDAPSTVSSFLQRMGRTGRRSGTYRNCLFLATSEPALVQATALVSLWQKGYIEPVTPPDFPAHLLVQQVLALLLQDGACHRNGLVTYLMEVPSFQRIGLESIENLLNHMLLEGVLAEDQGVLWLGDEGEKRYGFRNFIQLSSIFDTPPMYTVMCGRSEVGFVDELQFHRMRRDQQVLLLGGRSWLVKDVDRKRMTVQVEATRLPGRAQWTGAGPSLGFELCQEIKELLSGETLSPVLSKRGREAMKSIQAEFHCIANAPLLLEVRAKEMYLWTFAGMKINNTLALYLQDNVSDEATPENLGLRMEGVKKDEVLKVLRDASSQKLEEVLRSVGSLLEWEPPKFGDGLPGPFLDRFYGVRHCDFGGAAHFLSNRPEIRTLINTGDNP